MTFNLYSAFAKPALVIAVVHGLVWAQPVYAQDKEPAAKEEAKGDTGPEINPMGYFLGLSVGQQMLQSGFKPGDFDLEALTLGLADGMNEKESTLTNDQLRETQLEIQKLLGKRHQEQVAKREEEAAKQKKAGEDFLAANKKKDGVTTLKSGLQYSVIKEGDGESPGETDTVSVHYTGKLIDGTVFDSSVERKEPATLRVGGVIKGWQEALQAMKVGDKWKLFIPSDLAYGPGGRGPKIGPNAVLIFDIELLGIQ